MSTEIISHILIVFTEEVTACKSIPRNLTKGTFGVHSLT